MGGEVFFLFRQHGPGGVGISQLPRGRHVVPSARRPEGVQDCDGLSIYSDDASLQRD